jgi:hypothetical protein
MWQTFVEGAIERHPWTLCDEVKDLQLQFLECIKRDTSTHPNTQTQAKNCVGRFCPA